MADTDGHPPLENYSYLLAGNVFYRPRNNTTARWSVPALPTPHIRPRARRPQSIHIVSYPPGYIPHELRPRETIRSRKTKGKKKDSPSRDAKTVLASSKRVFERALAPLKSAFASPYVSSATTGNADTPASPVSPTVPEPAETSASRCRVAARPVSMITLPSSAANMLAPNMMDARRTPFMSTALQNPQRNSFLSVRSAKNIMSSVAEVPKPVASGSGVSCSIVLAEPTVFLTGFEHDGQPRHESANSTALLRGKLQLDISKNVKLKSVTLKLLGKARTEWPEGIPPLKVEQYEEESLRTQVLTFFHAMHEHWETEYGNQCTYTIRRSAENPSTPNFASPSQSHLNLPTKTHKHGASISAREYKRLSLQSVQSRSFGKGDAAAGNPVQLKGYKVFYPGTYEYSFELPIDHHQLETTKLQFGSVRWELEAIVERAGAFKPNLHGAKEICIVRVPDQLSLEMTEPISISRQWEDQLHYDIMISGKSFPIGTKIPIAFKLTPLAKVQVHKLKVFVTESIEYWTNDRRVTRKDPGRKILLLEKSAGKPLDKQFESSEIRVLSGGELAPEERHEARLAAANRRNLQASRSHQAPEPLPDPTDNLLGDLDLGLEAYWGSTEIEMNVQIPTCEQMAKDKTLRLHPDCSWKNVNVFHWIKIVMRISRLDPEDPAGKRRRHFEISIDSPFTVLNCRATQANTSLPEYRGSDPPMYRQQAACGCPDACVIATDPSPASSTGTIPPADPTPIDPDSANVAAPPAAHLGSQATAGGTQGVQRPMHLLRYPSFNPPAFDEDVAPPPMPTPPPQYDTVIGTPSVDGLADYFERLANFGYVDDTESDSDGESPGRLIERTGRVNVANPRTPGGHRVPSRSLEIQRDAFELNMVGALTQRRG